MKTIKLALIAATMISFTGMQTTQAGIKGIMRDTIALGGAFVLAGTAKALGTGILERDAHVVIGTGLALGYALSAGALSTMIVNDKMDNEAIAQNKVRFIKHSLVSGSFWAGVATLGLIAAHRITQ